MSRRICYRLNIMGRLAPQNSSCLRGADFQHRAARMGLAVLLLGAAVACGDNSKPEPLPDGDAGVDTTRDSQPDGDGGADGDGAGDATPDLRWDPDGPFEVTAALHVYAQVPAPEGPYTREDIAANIDDFVEGLARKTGWSGRWSVGAPPAGASGHIHLLAPEAASSPNPFDAPFVPTAVQLRPEGFSIEVSPQRVVVRSADPRGQRYALRWLTDQLSVPTSTWQAGSFSDAPALTYRAIQLGNYSLEDFREALDVLEGARFNVVQWETKGRLALSSLGPAQVATPYDTEAVQSLLREAARRQIVVVPGIKLLTHQEKMLGRSNDAALACPGRSVVQCVNETYPGLLLAPGQAVYDPTYVLPSGQSFVEGFVFPVLADLVALFSTVRPVLGVAVGHDESERGALKGRADAMGGGVTAADLFADHLLSVHDYLHNLGLRTFAWGDMLLDPRAPDLVGFADNVYNGDRDDIGAAIDRISLAAPPGLVLGDWHYWNPSGPFASNDYFVAHGLNVMGATWYDCATTVNFTRDQLALGGYGMVATVWHSPHRWKSGNDYLAVFSGDAFWTGGHPTVPANTWPEDSRIVVTDGHGAEVGAAAPGQALEVWVRAEDAETPAGELRGFRVSYQPDGRTNWVDVDASASYRPPGPLAGGQYSWRIPFVVPDEGFTGIKSLLVTYEDALGIPSITTHDRILYVGQAGPNLLANPGFETALSLPDNGWTVVPHGSVTAARSTDDVLWGQNRLCVEPAAACEGACNYWHTRQAVNISAQTASAYLVSYWMRVVGRGVATPQYVDILARDATFQNVCWPDQAGQFCYVWAIQGSYASEHPWVRRAEVVWVPPAATTLTVRLRSLNPDADQGRVCFDEIAVRPLM